MSQTTEDPIMETPEDITPPVEEAVIPSLDTQEAVEQPTEETTEDVVDQYREGFWPNAYPRWPSGLILEPESYNIYLPKDKLHPIKDALEATNG